MSLVAATDHPKNIANLARCCLSLAAISSQICFSFTENHLYILAVNAARTTNEEISFTLAFFRDYTFDISSVLLDGFDASNGSYSFVVTSKLLVMLFRTLDASNVNYIHLGVECRDTTPSPRRYKLNVEVFTKKQVLKKYQIGYHPADFNPSDIPTKYLELHRSNNLSQFSLEINVLKLFMDVVPLASEDFGIEAKLTKLTFLAYSKQIVRDTEYLKQPMLMSILLAVEELPTSTLGDVTVGINFRLKEFRNYVNLISSFRKDNKLSTDYTDDEPLIDAFFMQPGDPILVQFRDGEASVSLIQITANDGDARHGNGSNERLVLKAPVAHKQGVNAAILHLNKKDQHSSGNGVEDSHDNRPINISHDEFDIDDGMESSGFVGYGQLERISISRKRPLEPEDEDNEQGLPLEDELEFGPTQVHKKPTSLFD